MIDSSWTINEVIEKFPDTITVFNAFAMDACCGGNETLAVAADEAYVDIDVLLAGLLDVAANVKAAK